MSGPSSQQLPQKEATVFKTIVKFYEMKQYKKGLKAADSILKKFPNHGETQAMKGLTLNCMDKKKEAYELVRAGLKNHMLSHVCWHVYGLLYRSDRDYKEAIKCYKQALKRDKDNTQILRDLSLLQIQIRELAGFEETRRQLLTLNPKNRNNWIGFAVAAYTAGNLQMALQVLNSYESTIEQDLKPDYDNGEMLLYKNRILEELGDVEATYDHLVTSEPLIVDKLSLREKKVELLLKLGRNAEAEVVCKELLSINSENYNYHNTLLLSRGCDVNTTLPDSAQASLLELYSKLLEQEPRSNALKRVPLNFLTGDRFKKHFEGYVTPPLRKGVPSLFTDLKPLYKDESKTALMEEVMLNFHKSLTAEQQLPSVGKAEVPVTLLWVLVYLAQHYDRKGDHTKALEYIDDAIKYTPTVIDLFLTRAKILKHAGDAEAASDECETARKMDLADRFLNTMSVRYALRADRRQLGDNVVTLFTKDGDNPNNLYDMQCMWYEIEFGRSCLRTKSYGKALKKLTSVDKHFTDIVEDQFDFHTYCLRKMTLRSYNDLLKCEDTIYKHKFFVKAAFGVVKAYIALHDNPQSAGPSRDAKEYEGLSESEIKKLESKKRRAAAKAAEEDAAGEGKDKDGKKGGVDGDKKKGKAKEDADPDGELLAKAEKPLEETKKYLELLQEHAAHHLETHLLCCDVYGRKGRPLKVLQAIKRACKVADEGNAELHVRVLRFLSSVEGGKEAGLDAAVKTVAKDVMSKGGEWGLKGLSDGALAYAEAYVKGHGGRSVAHAIAGAEGLATAGAAGAAKRGGEMISKVGVEGVKLGVLEEAHGWMKANGIAADVIEGFKAKCLARFPLSSYFKAAK